MNWKFWYRPQQVEPIDKSTPKVKLSGPRELPQQIGKYLVVRERMDPDWVWSLRCVLSPRGQKKSSFDFRVFPSNTVAAAGLKIKDYSFLNAYPQLILFYGWFDKVSNEVEIHRGISDQAA